VLLCLPRYFPTDEHKAAASGSTYTKAAEKLFESSLSCFEDRNLAAIGATHTVTEKHAEMQVRTHQTGIVRIT